MLVLAIVHQPDAGPGVFADVVRDAGAKLDRWLVSRQQRPPHAARSYDAVVSLGGAMHPDQDGTHPWMLREQALLAEFVERGVPVLGLCLGCELLAQALGGSACRTRSPEIGWYEVQTTDEGERDALLAPLAPGFDALEWHSYECRLPPAGAALARSANCLQAYRVGERAWGIQFHAEVTLRDFEAWLDDYRSDPDAVAAGLDVEQLRGSTRAAIAGWNQLGRELCARFLAIARCSP
jgi:GMP synthase-like glutamine amidotransferase